MQKLAELRATAQIENAARFVADSQGMTNALQKLGATAGESASEAAKAEAGFTRYSGALHNVVRRNDEAYRAQSAFHRDLTVLTRALDRGEIELSDYNRQLALLGQRYDVAGTEAMQFGSHFVAAGAQVDGASRRLSAATSNSRNLGIAVQQAGYQIGDFAVQVASGQGVLRPFIQQGTQLISAFGPAGAVIGAAGAIVGALATSFLDMGDSADEAGKEAAEALEKINTEARELKRELGEAADAFEAMMLKDARARGAIATSQEGSARFRLENADTPEQTAQAQRDLERAAERRRAAYFEEQAVLGEIDKRRNSHTAAIDQEIARNKELAAALKVSDTEYQIVLKTLDILKTQGFRGTKEEARALAERVVESEQALKKLTGATNDNVKALEREQQQLDRRESAGRGYIGSLQQEVEFLRLRVAGREDEIPLLEAEIRLREILGRELLPEERAEVERLIEARQALNKTIEGQKEAEQAAKRAAAESVREWERIWSKAGDNIQDALVSAFRDGESAGERFKSFIEDMAWELSAALVFRPVISPVIAGVQGAFGGGMPGLAGGGLTGSGGFSLSGLGNLLNMSSTLGSDFVMSGIGGWLGLQQAPLSGIGPVGMTGLGSSIAGIGNFLGNAGIGYGVGSIFSSLGIGNATGSSIGGALGGAVGSIIPGVGTIIGSVAGSLIGGLFGNDKPSNMFAETGVNIRTGQFGDPRFDPSERSQKNIDASRNLAEAYLGLVRQIEAVTGGTGAEGAFFNVGSRDGIYAGIGPAGINLPTAARGLGEYRRFRDPEDALNWAVAQFAEGLAGVEDENFRKALAYGGTGQEIISNLNFVTQLNALTGDGSNALLDALKAVNAQFDEMAATAGKLGIATGDLEAARLRELAATRAQFEAQITALEGTARGAAQQYFARELDPLTQFRDTVLRRGAMSNMSSRDQYLYAQDIFRTLDPSTASAGDIVSAGQTYLQLARDYGASGDVFTSAFREVNSAVSQLISDREREKSAIEAMGISLTVTIEDQTSVLKAALSDIATQIEKLRRAQEKAS